MNVIFEVSEFNGVCLFVPFCSEKLSNLYNLLDSSAYCFVLIQVCVCVHSDFL